MPDLSLTSSNSIFTGAFWQSNGLTVANCFAWGVFLHAVLHVIKDVLLIFLLSTPSAVRWVQPAGCVAHWKWVGSSCVVYGAAVECRTNAFITKALQARFSLYMGLGTRPA